MSEPICRKCGDAMSLERVNIDGSTGFVCRSCVKALMTDQTIDVHALANTMTLDDLKAFYVDQIERVTKLTAAIRRKHPLMMGAGDGAIDTAIRLIGTCKCR